VSNSLAFPTKLNFAISTPHVRTATILLNGLRTIGARTSVPKAPEMILKTSRKVSVLGVRTLFSQTFVGCMFTFLADIG